MAKDLDRREMLTIGSVLAAGGLVLGSSSARAQDSSQETNFLHLNSARAIYADVEGFQVGIDVVTSPRPIQEIIPSVASVSELLPVVDVIGALLELSRLDGDGDLVGLSRQGEFSDNVREMAEELQRTFIARSSGLNIEEVMRSIEFSFYSINPPVASVSGADYTIILAPVIENECSLIDVLARACRRHIGVSWICGE